MSDIESDDPAVQTAIALRVKQKRNELGLSVQDIASALDLSVQAVYHYESGKRIPSIKNLFSLADVLGVSARWLAQGIDDGTARPRLLPVGAHPVISQSISCLEAFVASGRSDVNLVNAALAILKSSISHR